MAEEPNGWCEVVSGRHVFLARAAVSRWDFEYEARKKARIPGRR